MGEFTGKTHIAVVLDRSGSMASVLDDTIGGYNTWLKESQKAGKGKDVSVTLHLFDHEHELPYKNADLQHVAALNKNTYVPRGSTALRDAFGQSINRLASEVKKGDRALIVVITDGYENASREFSSESLATLIAKYEKKKNWTFQYLAANQDAFAVGNSMGMRVASMVSTDHSPIGAMARSHVHTANSASYLAGTSLRASPITQAEYDDTLAALKKGEKPPTLGEKPKAKSKKPSTPST